MFKGNHGQSRACLRYLGQLLTEIEAKNLVTSAIDHLLSKVDHKDESEREGCAQGLGLCANVHLDAVLTKVTEKMQPKVRVPLSSFFPLCSNRTL